MELVVYDCVTEQHAFNRVRGCNRGELVPHAGPGSSENIHYPGITATDHLGTNQNVRRVFIITDVLLLVDAIFIFPQHE
ncbi:hypothetical protein KIN20_026052 [Parelaphostrongylus tenuis]|uniref:Uncharacterized protein n=1 Tax=Parelaphostrongylus tenuis TaxID=148309 RepID=A0AAD5QXG2_PARTN|nr:hypothetical protein KIN20_026052 [Parelaphostrongylus tenuis]